MTPKGGEDLSEFFQKLIDEAQRNPDGASALMTQWGEVILELNHGDQETVDELMERAQGERGEASFESILREKVANARREASREWIPIMFERLGEMDFENGEGVLDWITETEKALGYLTPQEKQQIEERFRSEGFVKGEGEIAFDGQNEREQGLRNIVELWLRTLDPSGGEARNYTERYLGSFVSNWKDEYGARAPFIREGRRHRESDSRNDGGRRS